MAERKLAMDASTTQPVLHGPRPIELFVGQWRNFQRPAVTKVTVIPSTSRERESSSRRVAPRFCVSSLARVRSESGGDLWYLRSVKGGYMGSWRNDKETMTGSRDESLPREETKTEREQGEFGEKQSCNKRRRKREERERETDGRDGGRDGNLEMTERNRERMGTEHHIEPKFY